MRSVVFRYCTLQKAILASASFLGKLVPTDGMRAPSCQCGRIMLVLATDMSFAFVWCRKMCPQQMAVGACVSAKMGRTATASGSSLTPSRVTGPSMYEDIRMDEASDAKLRERVRRLFESITGAQNKGKLCFDSISNLQMPLSGGWTHPHPLERRLWQQRT